MDLLDLIETKRFLGAEFLMWLWYKSECYDSLLETSAHGTLELWFDDKLTLEASLAETERNDFKGGAPAHSAEAKTALRHGKRVSKAKLGIIKEGREWSLSIKAESLDVSGVKIPALLSREEEEQFYERMYLLEELEAILEHLYAEFLTIRLDAVWHDTVVGAMRAWVRSDEPCTMEHYPSAAIEAAVGEALRALGERARQAATAQAAATPAAPSAEAVTG